MKTYPMAAMSRTCPDCQSTIEYTSRAGYRLALRKNTACPRCRITVRSAHVYPTFYKYEGIQFRHENGTTVTPSSLKAFAREHGMAVSTIYKRLIYRKQSWQGWSVVPSSLPKKRSR